MSTSGAFIRRRSPVAGLVVALSLGLAACGDDTGGTSSSAGSTKPASSGGGKPVKIAVIGDQSGPTASTGVPYIAGTKAYLESYNAKLGEGQHRVDAKYIDDKFDLAAGVAAYRQASTDGSVAAIGPNQSAGQPAIAKQGMKVPLLSGATSALLDQPFIWSLFATTEDQATAAVAYGKTKVSGPLRVAALYVDVPTGEAFAAELKKQTEAAGGTYLGDVKIAPADSVGDWRAQGQKIAQLKPNLVGALSAAAGPQTFLKAIANAGLTDVVVAGAGPLGALKENWTKVPKPLGERFVVMSSILPADVKTSGAAEIEAAATAAGEPAYADNLNFIQGWIVGKLVVQAINGVKGDVTPAAVNAALEAVTGFDTGGLSPELCFGPDDRYGAAGTVPLKVDLATEDFEAEGDFAASESAVKTPGGNCP